MSAAADERAVLAANEAFYRAFAAKDVAAMEAVWAGTAPVACIHPGWQALAGRDPVLASWRAILTSASSPRIACLGAKATVHGDFAYVICYERVEGGYLIATNLFVRETGAWKMVHHQAGPTSAPDDITEPPAPTAPTVH